MGQYKYYINYSFTRCLFGIEYDKGFSFELHLLFITLGVGLTNDARGFGIWKI
jgi:hypothetical protein